MQVISPHEVMGVVEVVEHLSTVQDKVYDEPTVLVVHNVTGRLLVICFPLLLCTDVSGKLTNQPQAYKQHSLMSVG